MKVVISRYKDDISFWLDTLLAKAIKYGNVKQHINRLRFNRTKQFRFIEDYASFLETTSDAYACKNIIDGVDLSKDDQIKKVVAKSILDALDEGKKASLGMRPWFDSDILDIYRAGEQSRDIKRVLNIFLEQEKKLKEFKGEFVKKLVMPGYWLLAGIGCGAYLGSSDFMGFATMIPPSKWPSISKLSLDISYFIAGNGKLLTFLCGLLLLGWKMTAESYIGMLRPKLDKVAPFNIYKSFKSLSVIKLIAILKSTMASDLRAIEVAKVNSNQYVNTFIEPMISKLEKGESQLARAMDTGLFPPRLMSRLYSISTVPGDEAKNRALLLVTEQAESEIRLQLRRTVMILSFVSWLIAIGLTGTILIGFAMLILNIQSFLTN
jgi:type II secretory pathway component PulF